MFFCRITSTTSNQEVQIGKTLDLIFKVSFTLRSRSTTPMTHFYEHARLWEIKRVFWLVTIVCKNCFIRFRAFLYSCREQERGFYGSSWKSQRCNSIFRSSEERVAFLQATILGNHSISPTSLDLLSSFKKDVLLHVLTNRKIYR